MGSIKNLVKALEAQIQCGIVQGVVRLNEGQTKPDWWTLEVGKTLGVEAAGCKELLSVAKELLDKVQYDIAQGEVKSVGKRVTARHYKPQEIYVTHVPWVIDRFRDSQDLTKTRYANIGVGKTITQEVQFILDLTAATENTKASRSWYMWAVPPPGLNKEIVLAESKSGEILG